LRSDRWVVEEIDAHVRVIRSTRFHFAQQTHTAGLVTRLDRMEFVKKPVNRNKRA
jgi:hypothetical protein